MAPKLCVQASPLALDLVATPPVGELRELILVGASALELRRKAIDDGMITLRRSGLLKVMDGVTTIEEVARETVK